MTISRSRALASLAAIAALLTAAPSAQADHIDPNSAIQVTSVDPATRTVVGTVLCMPAEQVGQTVTYTVTPQIEFDQFRPGQRTGIAVTPENVILSAGRLPCAAPGGPEPDGEGFGPGPGAQLPAFNNGFITRVWKFDVDVDHAEAGALHVTIKKLLNLPKRFKTQDDELVDEAAIALLSSKVRVFDNGKRVPLSRLEDAESAQVQGKLLPPRKWEKDEDGDAVPTIRAKKVTL